MKYLHEYMTEQEFFNQVWEYASTKKYPSSIKGGNNCFYRYNNYLGNVYVEEPCLIGKFIHDDHYSDKFEGYRANIIIRDYFAINNHLIVLAKELQKCHDIANIMIVDNKIELKYFNETLMSKLKKVAELFKLELPISV